MDLWNLVVVFLELVDQLSGIQLAVAASGLDDLGLLLKGEVLPGEVGADVLLEESKDLVVGDSTWVGEVVDSGILVLSQQNRGWEEIGEDGVGVRDVDNSVVFGDLGNEVTGVQVITDWHSQSEDQGIAVEFHDLKIVSFGYNSPGWG